MLAEESKKNADVLKEQIQRLNQEIEKTKNQSSGLSGFLNTLGNIFSLIPTLPTMLLGMGLKNLGSKN